MTPENNVFFFLVSWGVMIALLTLANKSKLGHVLIYYSLLLMILFILVVEYKQIAPLLSGIQSISDLNAKTAST